ncbi:MAG: flagellar basal body rod protein FlgB [Melioribacteraceae bacterium]|nr:flagellar basal body rod protein FlgB [Melioribacteraceae bacterium]MCF8353739.1 flagellar basal body rod protein FlgB [Melioribacteraceae bacterium]MCF8392452.1 flagellar basal body rod protein FlgB [Melioribacteraceae bacterium]MCF8418363.1 flagellar basal body rod protein FlgB [Melioribacteraceae bacterium]
METNSIKLLNKVLNYSVAKQKKISKNIANVATENYQREDVDFSKFLKQSEAAGNLRIEKPKHIDISNIDTYQSELIEPTKDLSSGSGKNNVNIDEEMAEMAQNSLLFKFASQKLNSQFRQIRKVISGGR